MTGELKELPGPKKKVASKVLVHEGYSTREIEEILGVDHVSVARYSKQETPDELKQFETDLASAFNIKEHQVTARALRRIGNKIDYASIRDALEVYKTIRYKGVSGGAGNSPIQINNFIKTERDEFGI